MAMLAEPRRRKRYNLCPRGKALYEDDSRFGTKMLEKMGWSKGRGLGANEDGSQEFVRVRFKNDAEGLGYEMRDDQWTTHEDGFNGLLKALNGEGDNADEANGNGSASEEEARPMGFGFQPASAEEAKPKTLKEKISGISLEEKSKLSKARVHYKKFTRGKDLSQYSEKDLANIFGKKATEDIEAPVQVEEEPEVEETPVNPNFAGVQTVSTGLSVADYFKQKMEAMKQKLANKQNTDSAAAPKANPFSDEAAAEDPEEEPAKKKKKKKDKKREEEEPEEPAAEQKKKKKSKRAAEEDAAELEKEASATEETSPPKRKKKKKDKLEPTEELKVPEEEAAAEPEPKKKKKSKKTEEISIEAPVEAELSEKPAKKKSKKSKKGEVESKEEKEETVKDAEVPEVLEESEETTSKTKKKKSKTKAPKLDSDAAEEQESQQPEKKKKESKKHATEVSANQVDIESSSDDSDSPAANKSGEYLSTEQLAAKLDSYNVFAVSSFCAEKFHILNMDAFKDASLAKINGYAFDENIRLEVVEATMDAQRITSLWEGRTIKYTFTRPVASKFKFRRVVPADIKKINRVKAFSGL